MAASAAFSRDWSSRLASANTSGPTTNSTYIATIIASLIVIPNPERPLCGRYAQCPQCKFCSRNPTSVGMVNIA
jgi:hypothetical protein